MSNLYGVFPVTLDAAVVNPLSTQPSAVASLTTRDAELADLLARAGLEPRLRRPLLPDYAWRRPRGQTADV